MSLVFFPNWETVHNTTLYPALSNSGSLRRYVISIKSLLCVLKKVNSKVHIQWAHYIYIFNYICTFFVLFQSHVSFCVMFYSCCIHMNVQILIELQDRFKFFISYNVSNVPSETHYCPPSHRNTTILLLRRVGPHVSRRRYNSITV